MCGDADQDRGRQNERDTEGDRGSLRERTREKERYRKGERERYIYQNLNIVSYLELILRSHLLCYKFKCIN